MTREIKFRCWDKENKKWVDEEHFNIRPSGAVCKWEWNTWKFEPTDECIVAQYTGLKDKNGVEVFESDIVLIDGRRTVCVWRESEAGFSFQWETDDHHFYCAEYITGGKIIGNIYENPELLDNK